VIRNSGLDRLVDRNESVRGMPNSTVRRSLRPLANAVRSVVGTAGLFDKCTEMQAKLDAFSDRLAGLAGSPPVPLTKMEAVAALSLESSATYTDLTGEPPPVIEPATHGGGSRLCRQGDFATDAFRYWVGQFGISPVMHRKLWEWFFVTDVLATRGFLRQGARGLGFGVGMEPLTALFAAHDCQVVATDLDPASTEASAQGWIDTDQHASKLDSLSRPRICPPEKFSSLVTFRFVNMNDIPADLRNFDFTWSCCSLEHLGSLQHGMDFVINSVNCLRAGGIAVHTTEFNLSSETETFESKECSVYRRHDMQQLASELEARGHKIEPIDWNRGNGIADRYVDLPPYNAPMHLRLQLGAFVCTSIGMVIHAKG
jgi:hypothetical protein